MSIGMPGHVMLELCRVGVEQCWWPVHTLWSMLYVCRDWRRAMVRERVLARVWHGLPWRTNPSYETTEGIPSADRLVKLLRTAGDAQCALAGSLALFLAYERRLPKWLVCTWIEYDNVPLAKHTMLVNDIDVVMRGDQRADDVATAGYTHAGAQILREMRLGLLDISGDHGSGVSLNIGGEHLGNPHHGYPRCARGIARQVYRYLMQPWNGIEDIQEQRNMDAIVYAPPPHASLMTPHEYACAAFDYDFCRLTWGYDATAARWRVRCGDVAAFVHRRSRAPDPETTTLDPARAAKYAARGFTILPPPPQAAAAAAAATIA